MTAPSFESVSTWRQEPPASSSSVRRSLVERCARIVMDRSPRRLRVAIDGWTAAGKTSFGHELAAAIRIDGRSTARASLDDFKHPWRHAAEHGYDRLSGAGYYRNPWDVASVRALLLEPAGADGHGEVCLCAHDPLTGIDHRDVRVRLPADTVLIVDGVFALRPEYDDLWDLRVWLDVDPAGSLARGIARDAASEGHDEAVRLHQDRYPRGGVDLRRRGGSRRGRRPRHRQPRLRCAAVGQAAARVRMSHDRNSSAS